MPARLRITSSAPTVHFAFEATAGRPLPSPFVRKTLPRPAIRGIEVDVRSHSSGPRKTAKSNPQGERGGVHQFGVPSKGNAKFPWGQHFIHHRAPQGMADFVLANGSMFSNWSGEGDIRRAKTDPSLLARCSQLPDAQGRKRRYIARTPEELYHDREDLRDVRDILPGCHLVLSGSEHPGTQELY